MPRTARWAILLLAVMVLFVTGCREQAREQALAEGSRLVGAGNAKGAVVIYKNLLERDANDSQARYDLAVAYLALDRPKQAEREAQQLAAGPNPPKRLPLLLGMIHVAKDEAGEAQKELNAYLSIDPDSAEAWEFLGHARARANDLPEAVQAYQRSLSLDPGGIKARIGLVVTRISQGLLPQARAEVDVLLAAEPDNHSGLLLLAEVQAKNNDLPGAVATYGTIVAKYSNDIAARYYEAFYRLVDQGASEEVERAARKLIKEFPNRPEGYKLQGLLDLTRGASAQAVTNLQQALRLRSEIQIHYYLAQAYERNGSLEMAISELRLVLDNSPQHAKARQLLASLHLRMNRPDAAIAELEKLLEFHPDDARAKLMLGDIYRTKRQFDKSLGFYNTIPEDGEASAEAHLRKGLIMTATGRPEQAEAELRLAEAKAPDNLEVRLTLAGMLNKRRRPDEAASVLDLEGLSPANVAQAQVVKAALRIQQGRTDDALALLEKAKELDPKLIAAYYAAATIHSQNNEPAKALEQYRQLLVNDPLDPVAHAALATSLEAEGNFGEAQKHLEQAAESRQLTAFLDLAAFLVRTNNTEAALKVLGQCLRDCNDPLPALVAMAQLQTVLGDEANSLATIRKIEALDQKAAVAERFRLAMALKHWEHAETEAAKFLDRYAASPNDIVHASALVQRGDLTGAERIVRQAFDVGQSDGRARLGLAALLMKMGRTQDAAGYLDAVSAMAPTAATALEPRDGTRQSAQNITPTTRDRANALHRQENIPMVLNRLAMVSADKPLLAEKALEYAMAANVLDGDNPLILDTLGYALLKNERQQDAMLILQRAAFLAPKNKDIAQHLDMANVYKK